jgi:hypothetical protein
MKFEITAAIEPINVLGELKAAKIEDLREVYINDEKCPPMLRDIILTGLDLYTLKYLKEVNKSNESNKKRK